MENDYGLLLLKPHLIFNCDESGFEFDAINKIIAAARGAKHVPRVSNGQHEKVTVLACASAAGNTIPLMFIFKSLSGRVPNGVQEGAPAGTLFAGQKSGWIEKDLFLRWFKELFLKCIPPEHPVLLLVDGHKAHVTAELIETATANKVLVFCLPAHSSYLLQPLDLSLFGLLKRGWVCACAAFSHVTCAVINQRNFAKIFNVAWSSSVTPYIIRGGFRRSGIYPYDPSVFDYSKLAPSISTTATTTNVGQSDVQAEETQLHNPNNQSSVGLPSGSGFQPSVHLTSLPVTPSQTTFLTSSTLPSAIGTAYPGIPIPTSSTSLSPSSPSLLATLASLEESIGRKQRERFRRRLENGFDVTTDEVYNSWKAMIMQMERQKGVCPKKSTCACSCQGLGFCDCLGQEVDLRESIKQSPPVTDPPSILSPRTHAISKPSGDVIIEEDPCDIMLQPVQEVSARKRQRNKDLDPGNQCITGKVFLDAINSEKERKRRDQRLSEQLMDE